MPKKHILLISKLSGYEISLMRNRKKKILSISLSHCKTMPDEHTSCDKTD